MVHPLKTVTRAGRLLCGCLFALAWCSLDYESPDDEADAAPTLAVDSTARPTLQMDGPKGALRAAAFEVLAALTLVSTLRPSVTLQRFGVSCVPSLPSRTSWARRHHHRATPC
jgi:hypothetical protein